MQHPVVRNVEYFSMQPGNDGLNEFVCALKYTSMQRELDVKLHFSVESPHLQLDSRTCPHGPGLKQLKRPNLPYKRFLQKTNTTAWENL